MSEGMGQYFKRGEFACRCGCGQDDVDAGLITVLINVREHFGQPLLIASGNRCAQWNLQCGGSPTSQHLRGRAADFQVKDVAPNEVQEYLLMEYPGLLGIGRYDGFTHVDSRTIGPARWDNRGTRSTTT